MEKIRHAEISDLDQLHEIERNSFLDESFSKQQIESLIKSDDSAVLVLEDEGKILGLVIGVRHLHKDSISGRVYSLNIREGSRGRGFGKLLMSALEKELIKLGVRHCYLEVKKSNERARKLYAKLGYEEIATLKNYYGKEDGIKMRKGL